MKRLILCVLLFSTQAVAQNSTCADRPFGDSTNACANTRFVQQNGGGGGGGVSPGNPTTPINLTQQNGVANTYMRSDAAPALSQSIVPTWTGAHTFNALSTFNGLGLFNGGITMSSPTATALPFKALRGSAQIAPPSTYNSVDGASLYFYADFTPFHRYFDIVSDGSAGGTSSNIRFFTNKNDSTVKEAGRFDPDGNLNLLTGLSLIGTTSPTLTGNIVGGPTLEHYGQLINLTANYAANPEIGFVSYMTSSVGNNDVTFYKVAGTMVMQQNAGSAPTWAQTVVHSIGTNVGAVSANGLEIDSNNSNQNYTSGTGAQAASLILTGVNYGGYLGEGIALQYGTSSTIPLWDVGIKLGIPGFKTFASASYYDTSDADTAIKIRGNHGLYIIDASTFRVDSLGNEYALSNNATSDERLKHNIQPLSDGALDKLTKMKPASYVFNSDLSDRRRVHVIAQQIQSLTPECVSEDPNTGYLAVDDGCLLGYSIKAMQELKHANDNLATRFVALERRSGTKR